MFLLTSKWDHHSGVGCHACGEVVGTSTPTARSKLETRNCDFHLVQRLRPNAQCRAVSPKTFTRTPAPQPKYTKLIQSASLFMYRNFPSARAALEPPLPPAPTVRGGYVNLSSYNPHVPSPPLPPYGQKQNVRLAGTPFLPWLSLPSEATAEGPANQIPHHNNSGLNAIRLSRFERRRGRCIMYVRSRHDQQPTLRPLRGIVRSLDYPRKEIQVRLQIKRCKGKKI